MFSRSEDGSVDSHCLCRILMIFSSVASSSSLAGLNIILLLFSEQKNTYVHDRYTSTITIIDFCHQRSIFELNAAFLKSISSPDGLVDLKINNPHLNFTLTSPSTPKQPHMTLDIK